MRRNELIWELDYLIYSLGEVVWARQEILSTGIRDGWDLAFSEKNVWELHVSVIVITIKIERPVENETLKGLLLYRR